MKPVLTTKEDGLRVVRRAVQTCAQPDRLTQRTHVAHHGHVMRTTPAAGPHDDVVRRMMPMGRLPVT
jgi:hypothetical protein